MSKSLEEVNRCDICGNSPDGDRCDFLHFLSCGHDICSNHKLVEPTPAKWYIVTNQDTRCGGDIKSLELTKSQERLELLLTMPWCPICKRTVEHGRILDTILEEGSGRA